MGLIAKSRDYGCLVLCIRECARVCVQGGVGRQGRHPLSVKVHPDLRVSLAIP